mmetsp:Transcript_3659/g.9181  ORF Transcript_3659/g.9181 Transcript_3659/m.9181 type:complete len:253 (-) Transcript_3659:97-855(-)
MRADMHCLVEPVWGSHGCLEVERPDVLPVLLEERDEEVDRGLGVDVDLLLGHLGISDGDSQAEHLLQLELDGLLDVVHLGLEGLVVGHEGGELSGLVEARPEQTGNLLDDGLGGEEGAVLLGQLLHELLVLLQLLQGVDVHRVQADLLGLVAVLRVPEDAEPHARPREVGQLDGSAETLVLLRVVVLEPDLELHGFGEVPLLLLALGEHVRDGFPEDVSVQFGRHRVGSRCSCRQPSPACVCLRLIQVSLGH